MCDKAFKILALTKSDTAAAQVSKAEKYIREHYGDPRLSLNMITEHLAISTSYFSAIFKSRTGATFVEYLTRVRMEKDRSWPSPTGAPMRPRRTWASPTRTISA